MRILLIISMVMGVSLPAMAAVVHLKDGRIIEGKVVEENVQAIRLETNGSLMTYFADEVGDVDGRPLGGNVVVDPNKPVEIMKPAAISAAKRALIIEFMEAFGTQQALKQNFQLMLARAKEQKPEQAATIEARINIDEIVEELVPVYDRNFTEEELKAFIAFYGSDNGKKLMNTLPTIMRESIEESTKYMQRILPELADE